MVQLINHWQYTPLQFIRQYTSLQFIWWYTPLQFIQQYTPLAVHTTAVHLVVHTTAVHLVVHTTEVHLVVHTTAVHLVVHTTGSTHHCTLSDWLTDWPGATLSTAIGHHSGQGGKESESVERPTPSDLYHQMQQHVYHDQENLPGFLPDVVWMEVTGS